MRTRILNKMMASEVEAYLSRGGNTIFVAVGVTELHGALPVDCETILPEAFALEMAEQGDGLTLINLPYFFPGGTIIGNATVQMSVRDSIDYLMKIAHSLVAQGFKKIIFVSGHGPAALYIDAVCRDFFQETKIHTCHINLAAVMFNMPRPKAADGEPVHPMAMLDFIVYGAYKKMNQMVYLPVDPDATEIPPPEITVESPLERLGKVLGPLGGRVSIYYNQPAEHGGGKPFASEDERLAACEQGEEMIRDMVAKIDLQELKDALDSYDAYVQEVMVKYPRLKGIY